MQPKSFLNQLDDRRILRAIADAEEKTSGEIRVYISEKKIDDVLSEAKVHFLRMGMEKTRARNGVLIYVAPRSQNFAVIGDVGVHQQCGDEFWRNVASTMEALLKEERYTDGILAAIDCVGGVLATRFPRRPDDQNELPDDVVRG